MSQTKNTVVPIKADDALEQIRHSIILLRGKQVLLDFQLAALYGVETRVLNQAVRRNSNRFPEDFMFRVSPQEMAFMKSQFVISSLQTTENERNNSRRFRITQIN